MNRFDYVKYDDKAVTLSETFKQKFIELEHKVCCLKDSRERTKVMDHLEEAFMWIGKAIRGEQIERNKGHYELENDVSTGQMGPKN